MSNDRPRVKLQPGGDKRAMLGHPWIFSNELVMDAAAKALPPGQIVTLVRADGRPLGAAFFNAHSLIAARLLTRDADRAIDETFLHRRLERALRLRERLIGAPYYRLVHAEADGIPGCVIDRFGDVVVVEPNAAGADRLIEPLIASLDRLLKPRAIVISGDGPARALEGLTPVHRLAKGTLDGAIELREHGARFLADLAEGQKTGWFYDQRDNRLLAARFAKDADVLDLYAYSGGFGVQAARHGAKSVLSVDRSQPALDLAHRAAALNEVGDRLTTETGEAFDFLEQAGAAHHTFDLVMADPPAFVKSRKDFHQGARAYRKLARLCASRLRNSGFLFLASCSYHMPPDEFRAQVARGLHEAGRAGRILHATGAAPDHPVHPMLPESGYLKGLLLQVD
ncbi:class I SAM-dependent rRNA methyltransferase [Dongia deserti]|uniref:class I SAM-dependent rRNA methyltransferase n=1 Tax=Dongia deserti TaxID=2268030 RepID=UPI000E65DA38|nr:class I SAM-dependent rRNA methyltransferase [Dongia deserti]